MCVCEIIFEGALLTLVLRDTKERTAIHFVGPYLNT